MLRKRNVGGLYRLVVKNMVCPHDQNSVSWVLNMAISLPAFNFALSYSSIRVYKALNLLSSQEGRGVMITSIHIAAWCKCGKQLPHLFVIESLKSKKAATPCMLLS